MTYREQIKPCPQCGVELIAVARDSKSRATINDTGERGRAKWRCGTCGGILVGAEEIEREIGGPLVLDTISGVIRDIRSCPMCHEPMTLYLLSGIEIDRCATDGAIWFDRGELGRARREIPGAFPLVDKLLA